jgi:hypothetical protein
VIIYFRVLKLTVILSILLGTKLIDDKREEEKVNVYEIKFQSIYKETNSKEIALSLLFFILMLTAYKREEIT